MGQALAALLVALLIIFTFVPLAALNDNYDEIQQIKQNLNLAARSVCNSIENSYTNYNRLAEGYNRKDTEDIIIDKEKLLREFYDVLKKNYYNEEKFNEVKMLIRLKILVYNDRFFIAGRDDKWSPPYFFSVYKAQPFNDFLYVSTMSDNAYFYRNGQKLFNELSDPAINITEEEKNNIIIERINLVLSQYTYDEAEKRGLRIEIRNPAKQDGDYKGRYRYFNILKGVTFFVVYAQDEEVFINSRNYHYRNYNVTGYTFETQQS